MYSIETNVLQNEYRKVNIKDNKLALISTSTYNVYVEVFKDDKKVSDGSAGYFTFEYGNYAGSNISINLNYDYTTYVNDGADNVFEEIFPQYIAVAHELIHSYEFNRDLSSHSKTSEDYIVRGEDGVYRIFKAPRAELYAVGLPILNPDGSIKVSPNNYTENDIRYENNENMRIMY